MLYQSLIFDIDGTLWDSRALVAEGYNRQLRREGLERFSVTADGLRPLFGKPLPEIAEALFVDLPKAQRVALIDRCTLSQNQLLHEDPCRIGYPQVLETIRALSRHCRLFIVSNSNQGYPELCMEKLGLTPYIEDHLCYGDTGTSKGRTIRTLMEKNHIENAAYVGDTQGDYEATLEAQIPFIWASYGFGCPQGYAHRIEDFSQLLRL